MNPFELIPHDWKQISTCLNGPHVWQCQKCFEWTRSYEKPNPNAQLINGERYSGYQSSCSVS